MSDSLYKIVFSGGIQDGFDGVTVRQRLAMLYKANPKQIEGLFSGRRMVLKSGLSREDAEKFRALFNKTGAACEVVPENLNPAASAVPPPRKAAAPPPPPTSTHIPSTTASPYAGTPAPKRRRTHPIIWILGIIALLGILYVVIFNMLVPGMNQAAGRVSGNTLPGYSGRWITYQDPSGYYNLELPLGFSVNPFSAGKRSRIAFNYGSGVSLLVDAAPRTESWDPDRELLKHVGILRQGGEAAYAGFVITRTSPIQLTAADGYLLELRKDDARARIIVLVNAANTGFRMDIKTLRSADEDMLETLTKAVMERMDIRPRSDTP